jgi:hypothetical protein
MFSRHRFFPETSDLDSNLIRKGSEELIFNKEYRSIECEEHWMCLLKKVYPNQRWPFVLVSLDG